jgi:hypothetical protein
MHVFDLLFLEYRGICTAVLFFSAELSSISIVSTGGGGSAHAKFKVR